MGQIDKPLLLGVDGGGTQCRARLANAEGAVLGQGLAGPANIRQGVEASLAAVCAAADQCLQQAGLRSDCRIIACLALAGACEPDTLAQAQAVPLPFWRVILTSDARAACVGAHAGRDGGIVIVGTGSVGWAIAKGKDYRVGGWGFPVSDEGSGAWLGCEGLRRVLWAHDGLIPWTNLLRSLFRRFAGDGYAIVRWMDGAHPRDYASLAPTIVAHAGQGDAMAVELVKAAATHIDAIAARLLACAVPRLCVMGGLAEAILPFLSASTQRSLLPPLGDALSGALHLARAEARRHHLLPVQAHG
jgi:glucosamine kinase